MANSYHPAELGESGMQEYLQAELARLGQTPLAVEQVERLALHLALLIRWNAKINLTAVRNPEEMVRRHFVESVLCARRLPAGSRTLLDFGSGGGFPGVPIAVCRPEMQVTLAESQGRKAAFLREVLRALELPATVHHGRVEDMPSTRSFDVVTLRAVDRMPQAVASALSRVRAGGWLAFMATSTTVEELRKDLSGVVWSQPEQTEGSSHGVLLLGRREDCAQAVFHVEHS